MKKYSQMYPADSVFDILKGCKILDIGMTSEVLDGKSLRWIEGGLTLIVENEAGSKKKIILGYTEVREWLEAEIILDKD